ncbi:hypothetical protein GEMRC1_011500 [Eukaryota sp. GEM-RC1]
MPIQKRLSSFSAFATLEPSNKRATPVFIDLEDDSPSSPQPSISTAANAPAPLTSPPGKKFTSDVTPFFSDADSAGYIHCLMCVKEKVVSAVKYKRRNTDTMRNHLEKCHRNWKTVKNQLLLNTPAPVAVAVPISAQQQKEFEVLLSQWIVNSH